MCGLTGIVDYREPSMEGARGVLLSMTRTLAPRGPDDEGSFIGPHVALGHRRLSIIDTSSAGHQPFFDETGRYALVYNGEIYNYRALRNELAQLGRRFRTHTDTEVLLSAYAQWGEDCLSRFNGDFAFAIWDGVTQELFFARDRMGVKPFFYAERAGGICFASELKALLRHPDVSRTLDPYALIQLFTGLQPLAPQTLLQGVKSLPPGHLGRLTRNGLDIRRYWDIPVLEHRDSWVDTVARTRELLTNATELRLVSDVPLCGLLSGGVDSSAVCALAARALDEPLRTFTVGFDGADGVAPMHTHGDDAEFAAEVARAIGSRHSVLRVADGGVLDGSLAPMTARDLPTTMGQEVGMDRLFRQIGKHAKVALSGEAADEVCAGYYFFLTEQALSGDGNPLMVDRADKQDVRALMFAPGFRRKLDPIGYLDQRHKQLVAEAPRYGQGEREQRIKLLQYMQIKHFLPYLLDRADRISMASSVEVRVPFCDHRLVEYVFNVPTDMTLRGGVEKALLRNAVSELIPRSVVERKKSIFPYSISPRDLDEQWRALWQVMQRPDGIVRRVLNPYYFERWRETARNDPSIAIGFQGAALAAITFDVLCQRFNLDLGQ
jgi:asparagine synthase (glutamine-hydrolysing)